MVSVIPLHCSSVQDFRGTILSVFIVADPFFSYFRFLSKISKYRCESRKSIPVIPTANMNFLEGSVTIDNLLGLSSKMVVTLEFIISFLKVLMVRLKKIEKKKITNMMDTTPPIMVLYDYSSL